MGHNFVLVSFTKKRNGIFHMATRDAVRICQIISCYSGRSGFLQILQVVESLLP